MKNAILKRDLIVLVADRNMAAAVDGLLARREALGLRQISADIRRHPEKDSGCRTSGVEFLRTFVKAYEHALLMFDHEGCGAEMESVITLEDEIGAGLVQAGWGDRASVVIFEPELEAWVWADSPHVDGVLGWKGRQPNLRTWLTEKGFWAQNTFKPTRPKEAMEAALREVKKPRSSALYQSLAERVSLTRCQDRAFLKFKQTMKEWFGE